MPRNDTTARRQPAAQAGPAPQALGRRARSLRPALLVLCLASAASLIACCMIGPLDIPADQVLKALSHKLGIARSDLAPNVLAVVADIRAPRVCLAFLTGACLAMAGVVFQAILQNPLADPFTIGVSTGSAFGASLAIFLGLTGSGALLGLGLLPLAALAGGSAALAAVVILGRNAGGLGRDSLVLGGIIVSTFLAALISLLKSLDEESLPAIVFWLMGGFAGRSWAHVALLAPLAALGAAAAALWSRELDLLCLGDAQARAMGVNTARARLVLLVAASLLTAAAVSVSGVIGFVGLVAPHAVRLMLGAANRPLLAFSALLGGMTLVWSDALARTVLSQGRELPVGVVTALVGGPVFCLLLARRNRESRP